MKEYNNLKEIEIVYKTALVKTYFWHDLFYQRIGYLQAGKNPC